MLFLRNRSLPKTVKVYLRDPVHFYARRCVEALGITDPDDGVVRISMVHYNTMEEVDRFP